MTGIAIRSDIEPDIDQELLDEASRGLGTSSRNATLNGVLRDYVERKRAERREARENLGRLADGGVFHEPEIDEELLEEARQYLGVESRHTAINEALRRFVEDQHAQRRTALKELRELSDEGAFTDDLLDEDNE